MCNTYLYPGKPPERIELPTCGLQNRRSTAELRWQRGDHHRGPQKMLRLGIAAATHSDTFMRVAICIDAPRGEDHVPSMPELRCRPPLHRGLRPAVLRRVRPVRAGGGRRREEPPLPEGRRRPL